MSLPAFVLLSLSLIVLQILVGGAKLVYSLPCYLLLGLAGVATLIPSVQKVRIVPRQACLASAALLGGYVCLRAFFAPVPYLARNDLFMTLAALLVYAATATHFVNPKQRIGLLWVLLFVGGVHTAVGVIQFEEANNFMALPWIFRPDYGRRASGFYVCPNHIAGLLEMLLFIALAFVVWGRGKFWLRLLAGYTAASCLAGVALTLSRGGYLSTTIGFMVFAGMILWVKRRLRKRYFTAYAVATGIAVVLVLSSAAYLMTRSDVLTRRLGQVYEPQNMRLQLWKASLEQFRRNPVFGTGSGTYFYYGRQFRSPEVQNDPIHVHNDYLELLAEYGIVGAGLMIAFIAVHFYSGYRGALRVIRVRLRPRRRKNSNELALILGIMTALSALLVHSIMDFNLHIPSNTLFVAFLFGILATPTAVPGTAMSPEVEAAVLPRLKFVPAGVGALLICSAAPLIFSEYHGERARVALRDQGYEEARAEADLALRHEKRNPDLYYYAGEARHFLALGSGDLQTTLNTHTEAVDLFRAGLKVFPQDLRLMLKVGRTLDLLGRFDEAEQAFQSALKADPNFGNVYACYGVHAQMMGRFDEAKARYQRARGLGEEEISPVGLAELKSMEAPENVQRPARAAAKMHVLADFIGRDDGDEEDEMADDEAKGK